MGENLEISKGTSLDVPACAELLLLSDPWKSYGFTCEDLSLRISPAIDGLYIVRSLSKVLAFLLFKPNGFSGAPEVSLLCVTPNSQRKGIGRALMQKAEEMAFAIDKNLVLRLSEHPGAREFYEKLGYVESHVFSDWILAGKYQVIMSKTLGRRRLN